ncbi:MAG: hypothetical protein JWM26_2884 [Betaproteobacteria bacterium]|nr:hypothetical protein [Betaproteobacteria bacterium]
MSKQRISYYPLEKMEAPGFESAEALAKAKASPDYWAKQEAKPKTAA